ncbi:MAG: CPBP family intramembrane glutamic endopeptidase, partial [Pseudobdellovibrio sp.]
TDTLERHMSKWIAIAVMVVPYTMIHFHKPVLETFGAIIAGMVLGHLSIKYRSWLGGAILHSLVALTIDFLASYRSGLFGLVIN